MTPEQMAVFIRLFKHRTEVENALLSSEEHLVLCDLEGLDLVVQMKQSVYTGNHLKYYYIRWTLTDAGKAAIKREMAKETQDDWWSEWLASC